MKVRDAESKKFNSDLILNIGLEDIEGYLKES